MVLLVTARCTAAATFVIVEANAIASIFCLFSVALLVSSYIVPDFLVLFEQKPEHAI